MKTFFPWLKNHPFKAHALAFLLIILPPIPLYAAARQGAFAWTWGLLGLVVLGNLLELCIR
jgi:hypothetical protein